VLVSLPAILAWQSAPAGSTYLGYVFSTDDQMVYAAWIRQAMAGQFLFDNRFTNAPQPGLTINLYFLLLGQVARGTGIFLENLELYSQFLEGGEDLG
jgi:arabinosyltransferase C